MFNRISTSAIAIASALYMAETETASNGVTLAKSPAPRILPDLSQAVSTNTGTGDADKTAKLKAARRAAGVADKPTIAGKPGKVARKGVAAQHAANVVVASNKLRRISRVEPICKVIAAMMDKGPQHVATMSKKAACSEREVRLAIDKLRAMKWLIDRTAIKTFGYRPKFKRPKL